VAKNKEKVLKIKLGSGGANPRSLSVDLAKGSLIEKN
jgi:hypothetical protein